MKVTAAEYAWHAANDKQYQHVRRSRKHRRKTLSQAEMERNREASLRGQKQFEHDEYLRKKSDLKFVMKRIEGGTPLPPDLKCAAQLRKDIEQYENANRT